MMFMDTARRTAAWAAVFAYAGAIFYFSSLSHPLPSVFMKFALFREVEKYHTDWVIHAVEYAFFGALLIQAIALTFVNRSLAWVAGAAFLAGALYGVSDEWHQSFVPYRQCSLYDAGADSIGVLTGIFVWMRKHSQKGSVNACLK